MDVSVAVQRGDDDALAPHDEDERQVVDPGVDGVEQVEAELGAVDEREEERDDDHGGGDDDSRHAVAEGRVAEQRNHGLGQGERGAEAQNRQRQEEQHRPHIRAWHLSQRKRIRQEADGKRGQARAVFWTKAQEANDAKHGKASQHLVERIAQADDDGVLHGIGEFTVIRRVGGKVAEADADGEEDLSAGRLPDLAVAQLLAVPFGKVHPDAVDGIRQRQSAAHEHEHHDDGQPHGEVDGAAGDAHALEQAQVHGEPHKGAPAHSLADEARAGVAGVLDDGAAAGDAGHGIRVGHHVLHVEVLAAARPRQRALERAAEVVHDEAQDRHVVRRHDVPRHDDAQAHAPRVPVDAVVGDDGAAAVGLADGDFQHQHRDAEEDQRDQVRDEPLHAVVGKDDGRVSQEVAETNGAALTSCVSIIFFTELVIVRSE